MMNIMKRVDDLCTSHGITRYRLSQITGISQSAFSKMDRKQATLSLGTIDRICSAFGISLAQFFTDTKTYPDYTDEQMALLEAWLTLDSPKRAIVFHLVEDLREL